MKTVEKIERKLPVLKTRKRVAAYARVSMESERMQHSLSAQVSYYSALIQKNPEWEYAGVFADYGISGTGTKKREEFNRMLAECEAGNIDIILTKSIQRFARNTVDLLNTVRHLKDLGIEVRFEKENINGMFLQGQSPFQIARTLTEEGIPSPGGKDHWNPSNIKSILTNEKYKGDALLQKTFTVDFLTKKKKTNEGEIPQYYVKDNHEAIIDPETFEMVQTLMATRKKGRNRKSSVSIFSSKVKCGDCGSWYGPKVWHSNDAYRKVIWQCNHKFDGEKCATPTLTEDEIKELFLRAANQVIDQKEQFIAIYDQVLSRSLDTTALESELSDLEAEINIAAELIEDCIKENAHVALDQAEYQKRYDALVARFDKANARHTEVTDLIAERMARKHQIETYLQELRDREPLTEFRETDWLAMVDYITVHSKKDIRVTFKDGTEIKA